MVDAIRFYLDQHISSAVAKGLRERGVDALTAQEAGRCGFSDLDQLKFATSGGRVVVSFDRDFLKLSAEVSSHSRIVALSGAKYSIGQLIAALLLVHGTLESRLSCSH